MQENNIDKLLTLRDVSVISSERTILNNISVNVPMVSGLAIVGLSGSGKTTLVRCLLGLMQYSGYLNFLGEHVLYEEDNISLYKRIGVLFQRAALFNDLTVMENCFFSQELSNYSKDKNRVEAVLRQLNLWDARNFLPRQLSGGMQHRAGLARVLVRNNDCLILDEPTTGQDEENAMIIQQVLLEYQSNKGQIIVVSHDHLWLKPLVQWSVLVSEGSIVYEGPQLMAFKPTKEIIG